MMEPVQALKRARFLWSFGYAGLLTALIVAPSHAQDFHTDPACWDGPRLYHAGAPSDELARRVERTPNVTRMPRADAVTSPNGAYKAWIEQPSSEAGGLSDHVLYVSSEQDRVTRLYLEQTQPSLNPRWINEKLVFLRVPWGRMVSTDLIIDAESGEILFNEEVRDGRIAFEQFQEACGGSCPCEPNSETVTPPPESKPAADAVIGYLQIDRLLNRASGITPYPSDGPDPAPLPVHVDINGTMQEIMAITDPDAVLTDGIEEWTSALVFDQRPGWFQIQLSGDGARKVWVRDSDVEFFTSAPERWRQSLAYLGRHWDGRIWTSPDDSGVASLSSLYDPSQLNPEYPVVFTEVTETDTGVWLKLSLHSSDDCRRSSDTIVETGWVPAWSESGQPVGGYYARGC